MAWIKEFDSLLDLDKKLILFLLSDYCLKLSNSVINLVSYLILSSICNRSNSPLCVEDESSERGFVAAWFDFGSTIWWLALSWFVATFGFDLWLSLWFLRNSYLVFMNLRFFGFVFVRENYLGVFRIWVCESASTPIYIILNLI